MARALRSGRRTVSVRLGPLKRVVSYLFLSILPHSVVRASRDLLVVYDGLGVAVVLDI
jgi:hypothetical protein